MQGWPGAARRLVTFLARPRKVTKRRPPLESRPVFTGCPCAACLDGATAQLDLARHTQRASLRDSNSARRLPPIESSCSARLKGNPKSNTYLSHLHVVTLYGTSATRPSCNGLSLGISCAFASASCTRKNVTSASRPALKRSLSSSPCSPQSTWSAPQYATDDLFSAWTGRISTCSRFSSATVFCLSH